jgi:hypothetical protein
MRTLLLTLVLGCATGAANSGTVTFKSMANAAARPVSFSVGQGRVVGSDLDIREADGCIRGNWGRIPLDFCRDDKGSGPEQHWAGSSGQFSVVPEEKAVTASGVLILDTGRAVSMDQRIPVGEGAPWVELRRHPALLAVAATAADLQAAGLSSQPGGRRPRDGQLHGSRSR